MVDWTLEDLGGHGGVACPVPLQLLLAAEIAACASIRSGLRASFEWKQRDIEGTSNRAGRKALWGKTEQQSTERRTVQTRQRRPRQKSRPTKSHSHPKQPRRKGSATRPNAGPSLPGAARSAPPASPTPPAAAGSANASRPLRAPRPAAARLRRHKAPCDFSPGCSGQQVTHLMSESSSVYGCP